MGSSPPARGRQHVRERNPAGLGFIPASVGPTPRTVTPKRVLRVHPRARGADRRTSAQFGFIPACGAALLSGLAARRLGFIPACGAASRRD